MCIVAIAWQLFDELPLVLLSNRDEFFARPTTSAHQWQDLPIYAGRDDKSGGSWLGFHQTTQQAKKVASESQDAAVTRHQNGRWAAVLNFRDTVQAAPDQRSRGELVTNFLVSDDSPMMYAKSLDLQAFAGFNLVVGDSKQAVLVNNRGYPPTALYSGLHVVSNGQPDSGWFKAERLRLRVRQEVLPLIAESLTPHLANQYGVGWEDWQAAVLNVLSDTKQANYDDSDSDNIPDTGMSHSLEQALSSICIDTPELPVYGTRTQSILTLRRLPNAVSPELHLHSREYDMSK